MKWNWCATKQEVNLLFENHLMIFLSIAIILFFAVILHCTHGNKIVWNWPIVGMLPTIIANINNLQDHCASVLREHDCTMVFKGPWFTGMDFVLTCSPANVNHIFNVHFSNYPKGPQFLEMFDILGEGILNVDGDLWVDQRRIAHSHMSHPRFRSSVIECTRNKVVKVLLPLLDHAAEFNKVVDLSEIFMRFTFDTTCTLVLGADTGCLACDFPIVPFAKALDESEQVLLFRHTVPMFWWKLLRWLQVGQEKKIIDCKKVIDDFIIHCIQERRERQKMKHGEMSNIEQGVPMDLMGQYMEDAREHPNSFRSDDKFLRDTLLTFLGAGKDVTGAALVLFFWLIANNLDAEKKILEELKEIRAMSPSKNHSNLDDELIVFDAEEIDTLAYLHASLCETLRLYPPIPFNHKEAIITDKLPSGHAVQPGTRILFSIYSMGRMESIWGADCLEFKPERWISEKGEFRQEPSYKFMAFNSGRRSCIGKNMAFTQMKLVGSAVIFNYKVELIKGHIVQPKDSIVLHTKNGLTVRLTKRRINGY